MIGFVGLGNMGSALAANLADAGFRLVAYDVSAAPTAVPTGGELVDSVEDIARVASTVVLSLPTGAATADVCNQIMAVPPNDRITRQVIDTSTIGVLAAQEIAELIEVAGISYLDAPVSGGVNGARARTLMVMYAGPPLDAGTERVLAGLSDCRRRVGDRAGQAQALKLANNFLSASALVATSEAVDFGVSFGLDMGVMLDVFNESSGRNSATSDKFPKHVLTGTYAAGFTNSLMAKDLKLYLDQARSIDGAQPIGGLIERIWADFARTSPGADFTSIYPFLTAGQPTGLEKAKRDV
jgi:3-hydroxyisobutyrate dehydrogenase